MCYRPAVAKISLVPNYRAPGTMLDKSELQNMHVNLAILRRTVCMPTHCMAVSIGAVNLILTMVE